MFRRVGITLLAALALSCSRSGERAIQRGNQAAQKGQYDAALEAYDAATTKAPGNARAWALKGVALSRLGRTADADAAFAKAVQLEPGQPTAIEGQAVLALDAQDAGAALTVLDALGDQVNATAPALRVRARALLARGGQGDAEAALAQARSALERNDKDIDAAYLQGSALVALARYAEAQDDFEALQREAPKSPLGAWGLARLAAAQGRSTDALLYLKSAKEVAGDAWRPQAVEADPAFAFLRPMPEFRALTEP